MARMTEHLCRTIKQWTNVCFQKAMVECYPQLFSDDDVYEMSEIEMKSKLINSGKGDYANNEPLNAAYLRYLKQLPTKQLELIIEADTKQKVKRHPFTIDAIMDELFERNANGYKG